MRPMLYPQTESTCLQTRDSRSKRDPNPTKSLSSQCDRQYPCNHCTKRRRPEECVYNSPPTDSASSSRVALPLPPLREAASCQVPDFAQHQEFDEQLGVQPASEAFVGLCLPDSSQSAFCGAASGFRKSFGYFDNSQSNTMALLRKVRHIRKEQSECMIICTGKKLTTLPGRPFS